MLHRIVYFVTLSDFIQQTYQYNRLQQSNFLSVEQLNVIKTH